MQQLQSEETLPGQRIASDLYSHFKHVHPEFHEISESAVQHQEKNEKDDAELLLITDNMFRCKTSLISNQLFDFFEDPDVPKRMVNNNQFKIGSQRFTVAYTLSRTLRSNFKEFFSNRQESGTFRIRGYNVRRMISVEKRVYLWCMVSPLDEKSMIHTRCVCNFKMVERSDAPSLRIVLRIAVDQRLGARFLNYIVSD